MTRFAAMEDLRAACLTLPEGDDAAVAEAQRRQDSLTKPQGSLGRLEEIVAWLARWQGRARPKLDNVAVIVFAGSHGITAQGVSAFPAEVTVQMVVNFPTGGAAINQLARAAGASLEVIPLEVERPTGDFTRQAAMSEAEFLAAVSVGYDAVGKGTDLIVLGKWASATRRRQARSPPHFTASRAKNGSAVAPVSTMPGLRARPPPLTPASIGIAPTSAIR